ncbi:non-hydrolyzing UDP-N-acetylglucosamine 2-epimerase [Saccharopolyspora shandongensis]|uniref:non-hydrolyzing UDP-N-acetylglucosamine 2-epimerase n=1 Tax=Saccharopolyspora shandongensis TaxID=418495 RepID=UPI0033FF203D
MSRIACVVSARPNHMKIKPITDALEERGAEAILVHIGQHCDRAMNDVFFEDLGIRRLDRHLEIGSGTPAERTARTMLAFEPVFLELRPDIVVVVGDGNSTLSCALVAAKGGALVAHVEAGLRSGDRSMPEELNRVAVDRVSDVLLVASADGMANLRAEGYRRDQTYLVGNVMVDTLMANLDRARTRPILTELGLARRGFGLVTLHRRGNVDDEQVLTSVLEALDEVGRKLPLVFPVDPRTRARLRGRTPAGVLLTDPLRYLDFVALEDSAAIVLTDSGGVQAETTALGVPCLTLRRNTEWPVTTVEGTNRLVGCDPKRIVRAASEALEQPPRSTMPELWDGRSRERIAEVLLSVATSSDRTRPTDHYRTDQDL